MTHHEWGDGFDFCRLGEAINLFSKICRYGRIGFYAKEKYGTMRLCNFSFTSDFYGLFHPGWVYYRWPVATYLINRKLSKYCKWLWVCLWALQRVIFNLATLITVRKYIDLKDEIMEEPEFDDLLYVWVKKYLKYENHWRSL